MTYHRRGRTGTPTEETYGPLGAGQLRSPLATAGMPEAARPRQARDPRVPRLPEVAVGVAAAVAVGMVDGEQTTGLVMGTGEEI